MRRSILTFVWIALLTACHPDKVRPNEVRAILRGYNDDTGYNTCFGWVFEIDSTVLPADEIPQEYREKKDLPVWIHYEKDTTSLRGKILPQCNLIKIVSIRDRK